jgi:hypothetical protein
VRWQHAAWVVRNPGGDGSMSRGNREEGSASA